jgi:hypothetical protein
MSRNARIASIVAATAAAVVLIGAYVVSFLLTGPATVGAATTPGSTPTAHLTLQTVAAITTGPHPDWVTYFVKDGSGHWRHSTVFQVPAHATIHVTVVNYDGASGLRNPFFGLPRGIVGPMKVDGKPLPVLDPSLASHTFAVPDLGLSVPIEGVPDAAEDQCEGTAPCGPNLAHRTITFTFKTGKPGTYRWQCFVPCAAGWQYGFGGPMQTFGYMDGFLKVV